MKYLLLFAFTLFSPIIFAQQINYSSWKEESKSNIRLLPKYGNVIKTKAQKEADEELIKDYLAKEGTPRKASELLVRLGFDYLYKGDVKTAMYRFNQAWLLDAQNENVYWGFGAIYFTFQDFPAAIKQYEEGLKINPKSDNILTDQASVYLKKYTDSSDEIDLDSAIDLFKKSYSINPQNQNTLFKISICYFLRKDCSQALRYYDECKKLGGEPITKEFSAALAQNCNK